MGDNSSTPGTVNDVPQTQAQPQTSLPQMAATITLRQTSADRPRISLILAQSLNSQPPWIVADGEKIHATDSQATYHDQSGTQAKKESIEEKQRKKSTQQIAKNKVIITEHEKITGSLRLEGCWHEEVCDLRKPGADSSQEWC